MGTKQFDLTNQCNLRCEPCYNREHLGKELKELSPEFVTSRVAEGDLIFLGGGETMMYEPLCRLLEKLYPVCSKVVVSTNATIRRDIPDSEKLQVQLSLISLDESNYREITNSNVSLRSVLENMKSYAQKYDSFINVPVYVRNVDEMADMAEFAKNNNQFIRFREAVGFFDAGTEEKMRDNFLYIITNITEEAAITFGAGNAGLIEYYSPFGSLEIPENSNEIHPFMVQ